MRFLGLFEGAFAPLTLLKPEPFMLRFNIFGDQIIAVVYSNSISSPASTMRRPAAFLIMPSKPD